MNEPITGSIEILTSGGESTGLPGQRWTPESVPIVLETVYGITALQDAEPEEQPTGRTPEAAWTGTDTQNQPVRVLLWADVPHDETIIAQALAEALAATEPKEDR